MRLPGALRTYFASRSDPYVGGDLANAQRLGALLWILLLVLTVALWAFSPPTEAIGEDGWIPAAALATGLGVLVYAMRSGRVGSWNGLLVVAYVTVVGLGVLQWLAGGVAAPYEQLLLLPMGMVAAVHPPRKIAPFTLFVLLALAAPFLYDSWNADAAASAGASFVIWCGLAAGVNLLMSGVRAQRLTHAEDEAEAREEARADSLTNLHNRRAFDEMLDLEVKRARRIGFPLCVAMVDIESFKEINDRWSYVQGDRCLRSVASTLRASLRDPDLCFRWGGDEFAIILGGATAEEATQLGERLRNEVGAACRRPDDEPIKVRFAVAQLREEMSPEELVELAGLALTGARVGAER